MWCDKCRYGSGLWIAPAKCPQCGGIKFVDDNPFPSRPTRSIRAMDKRVDAIKTQKTSKKVEKTISEDVIDVIKQAQHLK